MHERYKGSYYAIMNISYSIEGKKENRHITFSNARVIRGQLLCNNKYLLQHTAHIYFHECKHTQDVGDLVFR